MKTNKLFNAVFSVFIVVFSCMFIVGDEAYKLYPAMFVYLMIFTYILCLNLLIESGFINMIKKKHTKYNTDIIYVFYYVALVCMSIQTICLIGSGIENTEGYSIEIIQSLLTYTNIVCYVADLSIVCALISIFYNVEYNLNN